MKYYKLIFDLAYYQFNTDNRLIIGLVLPINT